jgi:hypothetical protein
MNTRTNSSGQQLTIKGSVETVNTSTARREDLDRLARECQCAKNALLNQVFIREQHPTYGITKHDVLVRHIELVTLLAAYAWVSGESSSVTKGNAAWAGAKVLGIDLTEIADRIRRHIPKNI